MNARLSEVEAVTFDFYNTVVYHRWGRGRGAQLMEYLRGQGWESNPWEHQVLYDVFEPHAIEYAPEWSADEKRHYFERLAGRLFQRLNVKAPEGAAADHAENLWKILGPASFAVFADASAVLPILKAAGYPLAVVSNWQCGLGHFCAELGLGDAFEHVLASAEVGSVKPDPAIFTEACRRLGVPPHRVLHVGDHAVEDFEGARTAGLQAVVVRRNDSGEVGPEPAIPSLERLPGLLGLGGAKAP